MWSLYFCPIRDALFRLNTRSCLISLTNHGIGQYAKANAAHVGSGRFVHQAKRSHTWGNEKNRRQHVGGGVLKENMVCSAMELISMHLNLSKSKTRD